MKRLLSLLAAQGALLVVAVLPFTLMGPPGADVAFAQGSAADSTTQAIPQARQMQQAERAEAERASPANQSQAGFFNSPRTYVGVGAVWEEFTDCGKNGLSDCSNVYPEFVVSAGF